MPFILADSLRPATILSYIGVVLKNSTRFLIGHFFCRRLPLSSAAYRSSVSFSTRRQPFGSGYIWEFFRWNSWRCSLGFSHNSTDDAITLFQHGTGLRHHWAPIRSTWAGRISLYWVLGKPLGIPEGCLFLRVLNCRKCRFDVCAIRSTSK